nr:alcohol dehydrogenase catalytic domain-containing protein [Verrucomicrobium spinosum]
MSTINAYAATTAKAPLEPFSFDAGELGAEEVEIKVTHCGICHSDLSMLDNDWGMTRFPFVPGHEAVGTVTALGSGAKGLKIGQHVGIGWSAYSCLSCHECLSGRHNLCAKSQAPSWDATVALPTNSGRSGPGFALCQRGWTWPPRARCSAGASPCSHPSSSTPSLRLPGWASSASAVWAHGSPVREQVGL